MGFGVIAANKQSLVKESTSEREREAVRVRYTYYIYNMLIYIYMFICCPEYLYTIQIAGLLD